MEIRLAVPNDIERVMEFYRKYWDKNHPMAVFRELMEYQHLIHGQFRYVVAEENGELCGAVGYICYNESDTPDISTTMVCTKKQTGGILSLEMLLYLEEQLKVRHHIGVGMNPSIGGLLSTSRGGCFERMQHFYRLSQQEEYHIAAIKDKKIISLACGVRKLIEINTVSEFVKTVDVEWLSEQPCFKDISYLIHRYWEHPVYHYRCWQWGTGIIIGRIQEYEGAKILRLIDWMGEESQLVGIGAGFDTLMQEEQLEYVDLYSYGISIEAMKKAGFTERIENDNNVIPNYFNPFEKRNVEIYVAVDYEYADRVHIFRGDSDQDRPCYMLSVREAPNFDRVSYWAQRGYYLADRTIQTIVSLKRSRIDFCKQIRMQVELTKHYRQDIQNIASQLFNEDTRFCETIVPNEIRKRERLSLYLANKEEWFVCKYKGIIIGFIVSQIEREGEEVSVYLAAVSEEYRMTGAAVSLYNFVAQYYKEQGYEKMLGRISSQNMPAVNIWASLGARFAEPWNVYLKER